METDYPAAHSMDTCWFAIDRNGCVAFFESGEAGAVPVDAMNDSDDGFELIEKLAEVMPERAKRGDYEEVLPESLGFYSYSHDDEYENWISGPYTLLKKPDTPLKIEEVPAALKKRFPFIKFEGLAFSEVQRIQPVELAKCESWQNEYVTLAGETLVFPGHEKELERERRRENEYNEELRTGKKKPWWKRLFPF